MKGTHRLLSRGTSPRQANFQSPALRNPHMGRSSSPARGSIVDTDSPSETTRHVARRLNYGAKTNGSRPDSTGRNRGNPDNQATRSANLDEEEEEDDEEEETILRGQPQHDAIVEMDGGDESLQMVGVNQGVDSDGPDEEAESPEPEPEPEPEPVATSRAKGKGRPAKATLQKKTKAPLPVPEEVVVEGGTSDSEPETPEPVIPRKGRPANKPQIKTTSQDASELRTGTKRRRLLRPVVEEHDGDDAEAQGVQRQEQQQRDEEVAGEEEEEETRSSKRQRTEDRPSKPDRQGKSKGTKSKAPAAEATQGTSSKAKEPANATKRNRKPRQSDVGDDSIMGKVQKGPPLPRVRGLVSLQRNNNDVFRTRSGRQSYRPLAYWKNERVVHDEDDVWEDAVSTGRSKHQSKFLLPSVKEIVRVEEEEVAPKKRPQSKKKGKASSSSQRRRKDGRAADEAEEEPEPWELDEGRIEGEAIMWDPDYEFNPPAPDEPVAFEQSEIAIAANAIQTREIRDATFRFAKLLSLPFFGAGVVDLPPGTEKKPKNSRKNQMTFFVHYGKVLVTVNETQFRISAGGFWNVPRGNYYNIINDYDQPARLFFSQGSEVVIAEPEPRADRTGDLTQTS
ncbi:hypothetical protein ACRALDRAFT_1074109 [Sodiomyces alcalophilus JCM 7366]|uniref:uncharacterized protein n=1 Tax=Sodiomyces alcalophilus JCM 7366 TaxID=591952 RepID=UPI0039B3860C